MWPIAKRLHAIKHPIAVEANVRLKHALVVEDDANERTLLAGYLRLCGFRVSEATDGLDALRVFEIASC